MSQRRVRLLLEAAAATIALGCATPGCGVGGGTDPSGAPPKASTPYTLKVKTHGVVAFAYEGAAQNPPNGKFEKVGVVLPRLDRLDEMFSQAKGLEPNGARFPLHHAFLKIKAKNLIASKEHQEQSVDLALASKLAGATQRGEAPVYLALGSPKPLTPTKKGAPAGYEISLQAAGMGTGAEVSDFQHVPILPEPKPAQGNQDLVVATCPNCLGDIGDWTAGSLVSRLILQQGQKVVATHLLTQDDLIDVSKRAGEKKAPPGPPMPAGLLLLPPRPIGAPSATLATPSPSSFLNFRFLAFNPSSCTLYTNLGLFYKVNVCSALEKAPNAAQHVADHVEVTHENLSGALTLTLKGHWKPVPDKPAEPLEHSYTLMVAPGESSMEIELINAPGNDVVERATIPVSPLPLDHFRLYYALLGAFDANARFWFPHRVDGYSNSDPLCGPPTRSVAQ